MISEMQPKIWVWFKHKLSKLLFMLFLKVEGQTEEQYWTNIREYMSEEGDEDELESAQRWIPVSERLPVGGKVLVLWKDRTIHLDWTFIDGGRYYWWNSGDNVTHWMPLPEPPEVQA